eukprot:PhM_4_TR7162/c0_g1_i1/m.16643
MTNSNAPPPIEDHYATLGLPRYAPLSDVKRAYRTLAIEHHPDRRTNDGGDNNMFQRIAAAYEHLSDEQQKERYDVELRRNVFTQPETDVADSLAAIQRDRDLCQRQRRVPLSAYAPGEEMRQHMKDMIDNERTDVRMRAEGRSGVCGAGTEHVGPHMYVTQAAVEETLRVRREADSESNRVLSDIERLHAEREQERERRRREREEKKLSPALSPVNSSSSSAASPAMTLSEQHPLVRCERADRVDLADEEEADRDSMSSLLRVVPGVFVAADDELSRVTDKAQLRGLIQILEHKISVAKRAL